MAGEYQPGPPPALEWLLKHLLTAEDRETVSGDLVEEYREVKVPALGAFGAARWFAAQVGGFLWRLVWPYFVGLACYWIFGVAVSNMLTRGEYGVPSVMSNIILLAPMFGVTIGQGVGMRSGRAWSGAVVAGLTASIVGYIFSGIWIVTALSMRSALHRFAPVTIYVVIAPLASVCAVTMICGVFGLAGGALGKACRSFGQRTRRKQSTS